MSDDEKKTPDPILNTTEECLSCRGTGRKSRYGDDCWWCGGTGHNLSPTGDRVMEMARLAARKLMKDRFED